MTALAKWTLHAIGCLKNTTMDGEVTPCSCGLDEALKAQEAKDRERETVADALTEVARIKRAFEGLTVTMNRNNCPLCGEPNPEPHPWHDGACPRRKGCASCGALDPATSPKHGSRCASSTSATTTPTREQP